MLSKVTAFKDTSMKTLSKPEARSVAGKTIGLIESKIRKDLVVIDSETRDFFGGWVFFYNTKDFLESGDFSSALVAQFLFRPMDLQLSYQLRFL
jgi:hypothetical protein